MSMVGKHGYLYGTAMIVALAAAVPAAAQTNEELKSEIQFLKERLQKLEEKQNKLEQKSAAQDQQVIESGNDKVKLSISGQVNRGVLFADNGDDSEVFHVDNDNSSTRLRFIGEGELDSDITVGTQIEVQFESNSTAAISFDQDSPAGPNNFTERKLEIFADSKTLGRLWIGQGDTASNGTSEIDLSGTAVVAYSGIGDLAGGLEFSDGSGALGPSISDVFSNFDGLSRDDRARYDTPGLYGFKGSVSAIDGGAWDAGITYGGDFNGVKVAAAAAYANASSRAGFDQYNGSVSVLTPIGISVTAAAGMREDDGSGDDPVFYYGKLAYTFSAIDFGDTTFGIDFAQTDDLDVAGDEFRSYAIFAVQNIDDIGTELYIGARNHELDREGASFDDLFAVLAGARVKF
ncbi:porin [Pelagibius litoralis]|uniref:Porin n=1 Tax=Pelagibius litoralis TaxID=374515 RepID=A0A967C4E3_9PROT|nr:porin [Pelagibius litoralis]NIA67031.1 porin [Pelagibius litoralis]